MTSVDVFISREGDSIRVGEAHFTRQRGQVSTTFLYDPEYLRGGFPSIDPALPLVSGAQYQSGLVRAFADSAPDRWGRNLLDKAERADARSAERTPRRLDDVDYLLGVSDETRQGALRFRIRGRNEFLGSGAHVPPLLELPTLLRAADEVVDAVDPQRAVKQLFDTGTTGLGGARPKAAVRLEDGALAMAKFPHSHDDWDVMAWEATALDLMSAAGIRVPDHRMTTIDGRSVLVIRRFDRVDVTNRLGYVSTLTATESSDGDARDYADIAEAIRDLSSSPHRDLTELFTRAAFSALFGNTDDHLRNHGFLMDTRASGTDLGWRLSPVFDVNPNPDISATRATSIMGATTIEDEPDGLVSLAEECDLTTDAAGRIVSRLLGTTDSWRVQAQRNRVPARDIALFTDAIEGRRTAFASHWEPTR